MITGELKTKVNNIWDTMWSGGISNPLSVIEQLTYLLFIKGLDELHTRKENQANRSKKLIEDPIFTLEEDDLRWSRFLDVAPEQMFETVRDKVFPFIKNLGEKLNGKEEGTKPSTYTQHMKDAMFNMPSPRVLASVVDQLNSIDMSDADTKGDLYEYMLDKIASAGQNGQFRTPRHIIRLMVDMASPTLRDTIIDPACGTAGFLVAASEYLSKHHSDAIYRDSASRKKYSENTFFGFDFDTTMLRIGSMNMLLHGVENPDIRYRDSLAEHGDNETDDSGTYSLILANPPFSGSLDYESTSKDLLQKVKTKKTELLFMALFERLLSYGGRAAVVVPAGVLESDSKAHIEMRKVLLQQLNLEAIIKLPHWVFKPYASVDTSILFFSKSEATKSVWFYKVENDGFADDASKTQIAGSDLPQLLKLWKDKDFSNLTGQSKKHRLVSIDEIKKNNYDLCPPFYLSGHIYPEGFKLERLGDIFNIQKGNGSASAACDEGTYPFITSSINPRRSDIASFECEAICIPTVSATGHGHAAIKTIHYVNGKFEAATITAVLSPKKDGLPVPEIYYYLLAHKDELLVPLMRGATNKSLNIDRLADLKVPIITKGSDEFLKIAELLDLRAKIKNEKEKIKKLVASHDAKVSELITIGGASVYE